jgi:hypothetical protein
MHSNMNNSVPVNFNDLIDSYEWVASGAPGENAAYVSRTSGKIHWSSSILDVEEDFPEDIDDDSIYVQIPHTHELDLGKHLVMRFVEERLPESHGVVATYFHQRGAYARFKSFLEQKKVLQDWYAYRDAAVEAALREWCADNNIQLTS